MRRVRDVRHYRRLQAVLLVAEGHGIGAATVLLKVSRRWMTKAVARYRARRCQQDLAEAKRSGRPRVAPTLSAERLTEVLRADPLALGLCGDQLDGAALSRAPASGQRDRADQRAHLRSTSQGSGS